MADGRTAFKIARRGIETGGRWLGVLYRLFLAAAAFAIARHVLSHSPIVHGLVAVLRSWLKTDNLFDLLKSIF